MTHNRIGHGPDPANDKAILSDLLLLEQSAHQCRSTANTELQTPTGADCAQLCAQDLPFDIGDALTWFHLLGHEPWGAETRSRAIPRKGLSGAAIKGTVEQDCESYSGYQADQKGIYAVVNKGGDDSASIDSGVALFGEWDDITIAEQIAKPSELGLPEPTFRVYTGGKSVHTFWTLEQPIEPVRWQQLMNRLIQHLGSDKNCNGLARCMRLPGGWHIDKNGVFGERSSIIDITDQRYRAEIFERLLPEITVPASRPRKVFTGKDSTLTDIASALDCIPRRVAGQGSYNLHRNLAWAVKDACLNAGYTDEVAIDLIEAWSPSKQCGWNVRQIVHSGGGQITAGTLFHHATQNGWRRHG